MASFQSIIQKNTLVNFVNELGLLLDRGNMFLF